jgi:hypothetical protein
MRGWPPGRSTLITLQRRLQAGLPAPHRLHIAHPFSWAHWCGHRALNYQLPQSQPSLCSTRLSAALQAIAPHGMTIMTSQLAHRVNRVRPLSASPQVHREIYLYRLGANKDLP